MKTLKTFAVYLKSPSLDVPDHTDRVLARTKKDAVEVFFNDVKKYGWEREDIEEATREEKE